MNTRNRCVEKVLASPFAAWSTTVKRTQLKNLLYFLDGDAVLDIQFFNDLRQPDNGRNSHAATFDSK